MSVVRTLGRVYDLRSAVAGAVIMGTLVAAINMRHGWQAAFVAAGKQALYTAIIAGLILRLCERIATLELPARIAIPLAATVSSVVTVAATAVVHHFKGTAEPWASVIPTALIGPPSFLAWAVRSRRAAARDVAASQPPSAVP